MSDKKKELQDEELKRIASGSGTLFPEGIVCSSYTHVYERNITMPAPIKQISF